MVLLKFAGASWKSSRYNAAIVVWRRRKLLLPSKPLKQTVVVSAGESFSSLAGMWDGSFQVR